MSGSRKNQIYTCDNGDKFIVDLDESNGEVFGFDDYTGGAGEPSYFLPRNVKMRYVNWRANDGSLTRKFPVGKPDNTLFLNGGSVTVATVGASNTLQSIAGQITSSRGEDKQLPRAADSGLNDGDAT